MRREGKQLSVPCATIGCCEQTTTFLGLARLDAGRGCRRRLRGAPSKWGPIALSCLIPAQSQVGGVVSCCRPLGRFPQPVEGCR